MMLELLKNLFAPNWFIPHGHCYLWKPDLVSLHIVSDSLITLAYYSIPFTLLYFIQKRQDVPFRGIFWMFSVFILSCGTSHLLEVWTLWHPAYWLSGGVKAVTAVASCYTAVELIGLIPKALAFSSPAQLEETNQKLAQEIQERRQIEAALRSSEARFRSIFEGAGIGIAVIDMEGHVVAANPAIERMLGSSKHQSHKAYFQESLHPQDDSTGWERYMDLITGKYDYAQMAKRFLGKDGHLIWGRDCYQTEQRFIGKDGQLLWCNVTVSLVRDADGDPQFGIRLVEDITARKQAEVTLKQYQEHLEKLVRERTAELTKANEQLSWQANHDELTGLANRHDFERHLQQAVSTAKMHNQEHTLCYLDLDRFKIVNDTCGHLAGDELLRQVSTLLKSNVRKTDVLARLGGDEFGLLLYKCSSQEALRVAQSLLESIQSFRFVWQDKTFSIGVSIGLVTVKSSQVQSSIALDSPDSFLSAADAACYVAKNRGRNRLHVYQPTDLDLAKQQLEVHWIERINQALIENLFCLYYQPIVPLHEDYDDSILTAPGQYYEVLLRLLDQETGKLIPPMVFLPIAERYGLMPSIDRWVICTFFATLSKAIKQRSRGAEEPRSRGAEGQRGRGAEEPRSRGAEEEFPIQNSKFPLERAKPYKIQNSLPSSQFLIAPIQKSKSRYTINLSGASLNDEQFIEFLKEQFSVHQIPPQLICFEITETVAVANLNKAAQLINELRSLGCQFALDDFGSGMSSFAYLKYLPVDYLKIDGTFVKDIADEPVNYAMVEAINRVGHVMGLRTIAEFVANSIILEKVKALGVDYAQGYEIAPPQPTIDFGF